jgi:hypothetical protein
MQRSRSPFELVIKSQEPLKPLLRDPRITWDSSGFRRPGRAARRL